MGVEDQLLYITQKMKSSLEFKTLAIIVLQNEFVELLLLYCQ